MRREGRLVTMLGRVCRSPETDRDALALLRGDLDLSLLARLARANKVGRLLDLSLSRLLDAEDPRLGEVRAALYDNDPTLGSFAAGREEKLHRMAWVAAVLNAAKEPLMAIKGAALASLLPRYDVRRLTDLDFLVPGAGALWRAARALIKAGCALDESENVWVQNFPLAGAPRLEGHLTLVGEDGLSLDFHSGSVSFAFTGFLDCRLWERARPFDVEGATVLVPAPEDAWLILLAHGCNHGFFTVKDLNDSFTLLSTYDDEFDWGYVCEQAAVNGLLSCAAHLLAGLAGRYDWGPRHCPDRLTRRGRDVLVRLLDRNAPLRVPRPAWLEVAIPSLVTLALETSRRGALPGVGYALRSLAKYSGSLLLSSDRTPFQVARQLSRLEPRPYFHPLPRAGTQVLLTEVDAAISERVRALPWNIETCLPALAGVAAALPLHKTDAVVISGRGQELVVCPGGIFATTVTMAFLKAELAAQVELARAASSSLEAAWAGLMESGDAGGSAPHGRSEGWPA